jgi:hypothetical protein
MTGSKVVWIQKAGDVAEAVKYAVKYVLKSAAVTAAKRLGRVVSFTRGYCLEVWQPARRFGFMWEVLRSHPVDVLASYSAGWEIEATERGWEAVPADHDIVIKEEWDRLERLHLFRLRRLIPLQMAPPAAPAARDGHQVFPGWSIIKTL